MRLFKRVTVQDSDIHGFVIVGPTSTVSIGATSVGEVPVPLPALPSEKVFVSVASIRGLEKYTSLRLLGFYWDRAANAVKLIVYNTDTAAVNVAASAVTATVVIFAV